MRRLVSSIHGSSVAEVGLIWSESCCPACHSVATSAAVTGSIWTLSTSPDQPGSIVAS